VGYNEFFSRDCSDSVLLPSLTFKRSGVVGGGHGISATRPFVRGQNKRCVPYACPHLYFSWCATKLFRSLFLFLSHVSLLSLSLFLSFNLCLFSSLTLFVSYIIFHSHPAICYFLFVSVELPLCCTHVHFVTITVCIKSMPFHSQALSLPPVKCCIYLVLIPVFTKHMPLHSSAFSHAIICVWRFGFQWPWFSGLQWCCVDPVTYFQIYWTREPWTCDFDRTWCQRTKDELRPSRLSAAMCLCVCNEVASVWFLLFVFCPSSPFSVLLLFGYILSLYHSLSLSYSLSSLYSLCFQILCSSFVSVSPSVWVETFSFLLVIITIVYSICPICTSLCMKVLVYANSNTFIVFHTAFQSVCIYFSLSPNSQLRFEWLK